MKARPNSLSYLVSSFRHWLATSHSQQEIEQLRTDDASYPRWQEVDDHFTTLLERDEITSLSVKEQADLLYLIARNEDIGTMIAWLSSSNQLSNAGFLKPADFLRLAQTLTTLSQTEFNAAKAQFATVSTKLQELTPELQQVLLAFVQQADDYTKTCALTSLGKLRYDDMESVLSYVWETVIEEHSRIACLHLIQYQICDTNLLRHYLALADILPGEYLAEYVARVRQEISHS